MNFVGIDPGITGAVACIYDGGGGDIVEIEDAGVCESSINGKVKREFIPSVMCQTIWNMVNSNCEDTVVCIEQVHAMPGQGVTSMFNFGKGYGIWIGICAAMNLRMVYVTPQAWKKAIMKGKSDKDASRLVAMELFPKVSSMLCRKKDIGRADALLIAEYGRRTWR